MEIFNTKLRNINFYTYNPMNYSQLSDYCQKHNLFIKDVAETLEMTSSGLYSAMNKGSLPARLIPTLCKALAISYDQFFDGKMVNGQFTAGTIGVQQNATGTKSKNINLGADGENVKQLQSIIKEQQKTIVAQQETINMLVHKIPNAI